MNEQARLISLQHRIGEDGKKKCLCLKVTARPVSAGTTCSCRCLAKMNLTQKIFCTSVCVKFGLDQNVIQKRCCHTVWWFNCSVLFSLWFSEDFKQPSLCCIFFFKMRYLTFFPPFFVCDFITTASSQSFGVQFLFHAGAKCRNELLSFSALSCLLC